MWSGKKKKNIKKKRNAIYFLEQDIARNNEPNFQQIKCV